jgi:signal-transduction protein with cAMP-binding, CBS, and nucleotidyltransferase domain
MAASADGGSGEVASFLARFPPFRDLEGDLLAHVADDVRVESYAAGTEILRQTGDPAPHLFVVRSGIVDLIDEGRVVDHLDPGEVFGVSVLSGLGPALTARARSAADCYLIPAERAKELLGSPAGLSYLAAHMTRWRERDAVELHVIRAGAGDELWDGIRRSVDVEGVVAAARRLPSVVRSLLEAHVDAVEVGHVIGMTIDELTARLIELAVAQLGEPPSGFAWIALGSAARHEQGLVTDQDHAMAFACDEEDVEAVDPYFAELAGSVTEGLAACGIARCRGGVMAENPGWRRTETGWRRRFEQYVTDPEIMAARITGIAFDYRRVRGEVEVERTLDEVIRSARGDRAFMRRLASTVMETRPAVDRRHDVVVEKRGDHPGTVDVKHGGITVVTNIARYTAIAAGITENRTVERLRGAVAAGAISERARDDLVEAFRVLWRIRLEHHLERIDAGAEPDDFVDPSAIGRVARSSMGGALRVIAEAQSALAKEVGVRA